MGTIFNIQRFCTDDGPGIRTAVFFKGCPLHCLWCHNPESQLSAPEIAYDSNNCLNCGKCVLLCNNNCHTVVDGKHCFSKDSCVGCQRCIQPLCEAMTCFGYEASAESIIAEVMKDKVYYDCSGGGITLTGGEPLYQPSFCLDLLRQAKERQIHICMETCGFAGSSLLESAAEYVDVFLFDYKETDSERHREYTGADNLQILENIRLLDFLNKEIVLRCPVIPGYNDREEHFAGIADIANKYNSIVQIAIEPYHGFGLEKYRELGRSVAPHRIREPDKEMTEDWIRIIKSKTIKSVVFA